MVGSNRGASGRWIAIGVVVALLALSLSIVRVSEAGVAAHPLAPSGSFFALADSGPVLYAASENGGSIVLERSGDRGASWSSTPVPYSLVAGGEPWTYASLAVDGSTLIVASATAGSGCYGPPSVPTGDCGTPSSVLVASSPDGGLRWHLLTFETPGLSVRSLQVGLAGGGAEVAWLGGPIAGPSGNSDVEAITSLDGGVDWVGPRSVVPVGAAAALGGQLQMAPDEGGLDLAFEVAPTGDGGHELALARFDAANGSDVAPVGVLPAPPSWTMQGSSVTPAYLLTPTYLIPLDRWPYTALPFGELQTDGGGIGQLPQVVALVPQGPGVVEIAATSADRLGVDCWRVDTRAVSVSNGCHVSVAGLTGTAGPPMPIVALIDGGGWWTAIGAASDGCPPGCPTPGAGYGGPPNVTAGAGAPPASSASVGTSVCFTGCGSARGLVAYTYASGASATTGGLGIVSALGLVSGAGLLAVGAYRARRPTAAPGWFSSWSDVPSASPVPPVPLGFRAAASAGYRWAIGVALLGWLPTGLVALLAPPADVARDLPYALATGVGVGTVAGGAFLWALRRRFRAAHDVPFSEVLDARPRSGATGAARLRSALTGAQLSWVLGPLGLLAAAFLVATSSVGTVGIAGGTVVATLLIAFVGARVLYHTSLAGALVAPVPEMLPPDRGLPIDRASERRTRWGAFLLPWNPALGALLGWSLAAVLPVAPAVVAIAFLPVTLLGAALSFGVFGPTAWTLRDEPPQDPSSPPVLAAAPG